MLTAGTSPTSQHYRPTAGATSRGRLPVAVWAVLTAAAVGYVLGFGANVPWNDEWEFVPALTGREPVGPWLWRQHNEHRLPLPRLVYLLVFRATHDYRAACLLQVGITAGLARILMRTAARLRGRPAVTDAFFPLVLLHWGHYENWLMGYQVCFALVAGLTGGLLVLAVRATPAGRAGAAAGAGLLSFALAGCGAFGLVLAAAAAVWVAWAAAAELAARRPGRAAALAGVLVLLAAYAVAYSAGYYRPPGHTAGDPAAAAAVAGEFLAMGLGIGTGPVWPLAAGGVIAVGGWAAVAAARTLPRPAAVGVGCVIAGTAGLAAAVGVGRSGLGADMGLWSRYSLLAWPPLAAGFLVAVAGGNRWVPWCLFAAAAAANPANTAAGLAAGRGFAAHMGRFEADARAGVPVPDLVDRYIPHPDYRFHARPNIPLLREAGVGAFAAPAAEPDLRPLMAVIVVAAGAALVFAFRLRRRADPAAAAYRFRVGATQLLERFQAAAAATGKPRGLNWLAVEPNGEPAFVPRGREVIGLLPVVIRFEPVPGSDMQDVPAAREPRPAVAVFTFDGREWTTAGRAVFNLPPAAVAAMMAGRVEPDNRSGRHDE